MSIFGNVIIVIGFLVALVSWIISGSKDKDTGKDARVVAIVATIVVVIGFLLSSLVAVPAGNAGVVLRWDKVAAVYGDGLSIKTPIDKVINMSVRTLLYETEATAASKDLQDVKTKVAINYKMEQAFAGEIYRTLGESYIEVIAHPAIQETVKEITARFNAEDMILRRAEVKDQIAEALKTRLSQRNIVTETVNITNFEFSPQFTRAIESKVVAVQAVLEAENKLRQIEVEARQAKISAEGRANAAIAEANGQAQALTIVTDAQTAANAKISKSLNPDVLQYILLDRLGKDIKVIVIPAGQNLALGDIGK